jgi:hypothetical protein
MKRLDDGTTADLCYVYCAQRSCGKAKAFMAENADALREQCGTVAYLHGGALEMDPADLVGGEACHDGIVEHNQGKGVRPGCLTCTGSEVARVPMRFGGEDVEATLFETDEVPEWYRRTGVVGALPNHFACDARYKDRPTPHGPSGADAARVTIDISQTSLPPDALLAYWAAQPSERVVTAERAYGDFLNSGIVQCRESLCDFALRRPGRYTADGEVFKAHVHLTEWQRGRWSLDAKTLDIE